MMMVIFFHDSAVVLTLFFVAFLAQIVLITLNTSVSFPHNRINFAFVTEITMMYEVGKLFFGIVDSFLQFFQRNYFC